MYLQIFSELVEEDHQKNGNTPETQHNDANKTTDAARLPYAAMNIRKNTNHVLCVARSLQLLYLGLRSFGTQERIVQ